MSNDIKVLSKFDLRTWKHRRLVSGEFDRELENYRKNLEDVSADAVETTVRFVSPYEQRHFRR